jgi:site-specific recombinase XerD
MNYLTQERMYIHAFRNYLQLKNYHSSTMDSILQIVVDFENYVAVQGSVKGYDVYLQERTHKNNPLKKLSHSTLNYYYFGLRLYVGFLEQYYNEYSKSIHLLNLQEQIKDITVLAIEEVQQLFIHANDLRDQTILALLYHVGLRAGEAVGIKLVDVNLVNNTIFISQTKTGWQRLAPVHTTAATIFKNYLVTHNPTTYLLPGVKGMMSPNSLQRILKNIAKKAGITKRVYPHLLRHSIATHLLANGMALEEVSIFLGHRTTESTQRYTHVAHIL